ncbi:hypothetical protein EYR88_13345 [Arthrobacter sp. S41]|nr:hypothetical protein EYR88_13345 [Arthrobacter sp. S41]
MMTTHFPGSRISIVLDADGVRRFATEARQTQPTRILAVVERSAFTRDATGQKHGYVPFSSSIMSHGHLAQRSQRGLHFDFAVTLCDSIHRPVITLTGTCGSGELDVAILDVIAEFTGSSRIACSGAIDILISNRDGLGHQELASNPVFCLNPAWLFGLNMELANHVNTQALAATRQAYQSRSSVIAYTDGSLPHHGQDRGAGAMVTMQGHWASQVTPKRFSRSPLMAETTGALLALRHTPVDSDLIIFSDCKALVKSVNDAVSGLQGQRGAHDIAIDVAMARRRGDTRAIWVRGHNGNCFNEAADRMAVLMARHFNAGINPEQTYSLMQKIVAEELSELALAV